jgi:hypothetical protein
MIEKALICRDCKYFYSSMGRVHGIGECYRYPPVPNPEHFRLEAGKAPENDTAGWVKPQVWDVDYCGEFVEGEWPGAV